MLHIIITILFISISYYIGLYRGMIKAKKIAKKVYREFGIVLPQNINL